MSLEDAILEKVRHLQAEEQEMVLRFAASLERRQLITRVPARDRSLEMKWLAENRANPAYANQWVVIEGDSVVASGTDAVNVYDTARGKGIEVPFVIHIVPEDPLPFGGW